MAFLECLGASREVGRSAFLLETDKKILLDYGVKVFDLEGHPKFPSEEIAPDVALISHAHLDHSGFVPALYKRSKGIKWFATQPTAEICELLWKDSFKIMGEEMPCDISHLNKALSNWNPLAYEQPVQFGKTTATMFDAGHVVGAGILQLEYEKKKIVYTGDFKLENTQMHRGAETIEDVDTLIIETTYANREHPDRKETEEQIIEELQETVSEGGTILFPAFAFGRTQELLSLIRKHDKDVPIFLDGMGRAITQIYLKYASYMRDARFFKKAVASVNMVETIADKREATRTPGAIITSAGMMMGGPVLNYLFNINSNSKIVFTGYNVEGTNGWTLLNKGFITKDEQQLTVDLPVEYLDLSAHAGRSDLMQFIKTANPGKIVLVHGDTADSFAEDLKTEGYDAVAPKFGDRIEL
jgi:putative mRNA 3-end processing factor